MLCERYKKILIVAAASGDQLPLDLRTHLDSCPPCRIVFDDQRRLLAAIDSGIRATANAPVPPSLLCAVHLRLAHEGASNAKRSPSAWMYLAATAALILALLPLLRVNRDAVKTIHEGAAENAASFPPKRDFHPQPGPPPNKVVTVVGSRDRHGKSARASAQIGTYGGQMSVAQMQVLVPPDQELLLARYARALQERSTALRVSNLSKPPSLGSPIDSIEVSALQLSPLPEFGSD